MQLTDVFGWTGESCIKMHITAVYESNVYRVYEVEWEGLECSVVALPRGKLFLSPSVLALRLQNLWPDDRGAKRLWEGWDETLIIPLAVWMQRPLQISSREGKAVLAFSSAVFMTCWKDWWSEAEQKPNQAVMHLVRALYGTSVEGGKDGSLYQRCCWAFLIREVTCWFQERSSLSCTPTHFMFFTLLTAELPMCRGLCSPWFLL